jgi:hypothetical protein
MKLVSGYNFVDCYACVGFDSMFAAYANLLRLSFCSCSFGISYFLLSKSDAQIIIFNLSLAW